MAWDGVVPALVSSGFTAGVGAIAVALIQVFGKKSESRARAADLTVQTDVVSPARVADMVTAAAGRMVKHLDADNSGLRLKLLGYEKAIDLLIDVIDEVLRQQDAPPELVQKLKQAKRAAQLMG